VACKSRERQLITESTHITPRPAERVLNRLIADKALSPAGKDWLIATLDPFHDTELTVEGHPDIDSSRSIVQCIQETFPLTWTAAASKDVTVFFAPTSGDYLDTTVVGANVYGNIRPCTVSSVSLAFLANPLFPTAYPILNGGWNVIAQPSGTPWNNGGTGNVFNGAGLPLQNLKGKHRLLATAIEVVNTTAPLYKGGSVVAYKEPAQFTTLIRGNDGTSGLTNDDNVVHYNNGTYPPVAAQTAANYPNAKIWEAEKGVYAIATLNDVSNPVHEPKLGQGFSMSQYDDTTGWPPGGIAPINYATMCLNGYAPPNSASSSIAVSYPFDNTGFIFQGLPAGTSLQFTVKYFVEFFPTVQNGLLQSLATPSAAYDPLALEIYSRCLRELPVACAQGENPLGEWFNEVLDLISSAAPKVGAVFGPTGTIIGNGLGLLAKTARTSMGGSAAKAQNATQQKVVAKPMAPTVPGKKSTKKRTRKEMSSAR
jgi:hypothetical protein